MNDEEELSLDGADDMDRELYEGLFEHIIDEKPMHIMIPKKIKEMVDVYKLLKTHFAGQAVKITCKLDELITSYGDITLEGKLFMFTDSNKVVLDAFKKATTIDVNPKTNGNVEINLGFAELAMPIQ